MNYFVHKQFRQDWHCNDIIPRTHRITGDKAFSVAALLALDRLPDVLQAAPKESESGGFGALKAVAGAVHIKSYCRLGCEESASDENNYLRRYINQEMVLVWDEN